MSRNKLCIGLFSVLVLALLISGLCAQAAHADEQSAPSPKEENAAVPNEGDEEGDQETLDDDAAETAPDDSDSEMPPNPQHMWCPENLSGEDAIATYSSAPWWAGKDFYTGNGNLWCSNAKKVIDVSEWEPGIDWNAVKASGVDGAILRIGFGGTGGKGREDYQFSNNIKGVRNVGMPYGIYLYSYAYDADFARSEANLTADLLDKYNCRDLSLPIYYDIERFATWSGHSAPSSPAQYEQIIRAYIDTMASRGYSNVEVYTYRSYLQGELNTSYIWSKTSWVAEYGSNLNVTNGYFSGNRGWQYTESGSVPGISGDVDLSAFTGFGNGSLNVTNLSKVNIPDGEYYIDSILAPASSVDMRSGAKANGTVTQLFGANSSAAQKFTFTRQADGSYVIKNTVSGRVLDVCNGSAGNGSKIQLWDANGSDAQRWFIRDSGSGYYFQSALGNWVFDVTNGSRADSTTIALHSPNGSDAQKFMLASTDESGVIADASVTMALADNDGFVADVKGGSYDNAASVQLYAKNGTDAQLFVFHRTGNGIYSIKNVKSGKMLDVVSGGVSDSTAVDQYQDNGTAVQRWCIRSYGERGCSLVSLKSGKALDVRGGSIASGTPLQIFSVNGTAAQRWRFARALSAQERADQTAKENKGTISSGTYFIMSAKDGAKGLDASNGGIASGTNVWLFAKNGTSAQRWNVSEDDKGYLTFINENSGLALDVSGGTASNGANVQLYTPNGTKAQKWVAKKNSDGTLTISSAANLDYVLDLTSGSTKNQTNVQLYASNGTAAQKFNLETAQQWVPDGTYSILSAKNRNMALDVQWGATNSGANVWLYSQNGTPAQQWKVQNNADGTISIVNVKSGKALDICNGGTTSGTNVWQFDSNGTLAQKWVPIRNDNGSIALRSAKNPALALDVNAGQTVDGSNIQVYSRNGTAAQSFVFQEVK